jgi:hypothetical protein
MGRWSTTCTSEAKEIAVTEPEEFSISLRILGNEMLGMKLTSQSQTKNWVVLGVICMIALIMVLVSVSPTIMLLAGAS